MQKKAFGKVKLCRDTRLEENNLFAIKIMDKMVLKKKRQGAPLVTPSPLGVCAACGVPAVTGAGGGARDEQHAAVGAEGDRHHEKAEPCELRAAL